MSFESSHRESQLFSLAGANSVAGACPLCRSQGSSRLFESRDRLHGIPGNFAILRCDDCHAIFIQPWLDYQELAVYYPEHYSGYRHSRSLGRKRYKGVRRFVLENYYGYPSLRNGRASRIRKAIAYVLSLVMAKGTIRYRGDGRFLDVGCGGASYLHRLKQWGWKVYGVEPSESGVQQARELGLDVRHGELPAAGFPNNFFDVIRLNNVLEHLTEPHETFHEVRRILKADGIVLITVPNTRSLNFWLFGEHWYGLDAPRHVISYCPKALRVLCDATGFEIEKIRFHSGVFNFVRSVRYFLNENGRYWARWLNKIDWPRNKFIRRSLKPLFFFFDVAKLGDNMEATLQKASKLKRRDA